jgi:hypothetical protein
MNYETKKRLSSLYAKNKTSLKIALVLATGLIADSIFDLKNLTFLGGLFLIIGYHFISKK